MWRAGVLVSHLDQVWPSKRNLWGCNENGGCGAIFLQMREFLILLLSLVRLVLDLLCGFGACALKLSLLTRLNF
jgi:hypothetical protein